MFDKLKELYLRGLLTHADLGSAVSKGWISEGQRAYILSINA